MLQIPAHRNLGACEEYPKFEVSLCCTASTGLTMAAGHGIDPEQKPKPRNSYLKGSTKMDSGPDLAYTL